MEKIRTWLAGWLDIAVLAVLCSWDWLMGVEDACPDCMKCTVMRVITWFGLFAALAYVVGTFTLLVIIGVILGVMGWFGIGRPAVWYETLKTYINTPKPRE